MPNRPGLRLCLSVSESVPLALIGLVLLIVKHFLK